jgi:S-adenosylmethionine:tRNA ribosyltransferase-isomerase
MKLSEFDYFLPKDLIAQYPLKERDSARLLVIERKTHKIEHCFFKDILKYLNQDDLLVLNNTKVLPARLKGKKPTGGKAEVLLLEQKRGLTFSALIKPSRLKVGQKLIFNQDSISGRISARGEITFKARDLEAIYRAGLMPLPPYIKREAEVLDNDYYQTVYAKKEGAIASPTAGLHFTKELLDKIKSGGANLAYITLHVGIGTFKPVSAEDITKHKMEPERFEISPKAKKAIEETCKQDRRIVAVGTTSLRALESYAQGLDKGKTNLFIYPGYKFKITDALLTNFHLPKTTLFMLVCAFAGSELIKRAYQEAVEQKYRFYSYGDAMLII